VSFPSVDIPIRIDSVYHGLEIEAALITFDIENQNPLVAFFAGIKRENINIAVYRIFFGVIVWIRRIRPILDVSLNEVPSVNEVLFHNLLEDIFLLGHFMVSQSYRRVCLSANNSEALRRYKRRSFTHGTHANRKSLFNKICGFVNRSYKS
jgi:hypothetical protein